jgi:thiol-disulfide isomerase/thioredoxin
MVTVIEPLTPDDIDLDFVARLVPDLEIATLGDEQVVIGGVTKVVALNSTGALILQFLDGEATLRELVDDFTDVLGVDRAVVEGDVVEFVRSLGVNGLLEGVEMPAPEWADWGDWTPPEPLEIGAELDDFTLPDLNGDARSLSEFRGRRVLLVNWSPGCGFCVQIAPELAALKPVLVDRDVELVFIALGDASANRSLFQDVGLDAPVLLRDDTDVDPFRGTGTPAAYLVNADGTLAEAMVVGADQVPVLARDLAGVDPATEYGTLEEATDADLDEEARGHYLPAPGGMCGPGSGTSAVNSTDWHGTRAYALGEYRVGLRYDTPETAALLDQLFAGARVNDRRVPDNYSVALPGILPAKNTGSTRSLNLLVHGSTQLVRSRSSGRVLAALLQYLAADLGEPVPPSLVRVSATAVLRDDEVLLLPPGLVNFVKHLQPRLAKAGMGIVDTPRVLLDVGSRELVVLEPGVPHDASVIEQLDISVKTRSELPWTRPGRYPLHAWFLTPGPAHMGRLSTAVAATAALSQLPGIDDVRAELERLADLFADVTPIGLWYGSAEEMIDQVTAALR